jgi:hypothetical protein
VSHEEVQREHREDRHHEDEHLNRGHLHRPKLPGRHLLRVRERHGLRAEDLGGDFLQHQRRPDGAHHRREEMPAGEADAAEGDQLEQHAEDRRADRGRDQRDHRADVEPKQRLQPDEGADHENLAVREVHELEHPEHQRVADGHERVGSAQHQAVYQLLQKHLFGQRRVAVAAGEHLVGVLESGAAREARRVRGVGAGGQALDH